MPKSKKPTSASLKAPTAVNLQACSISWAANFLRSSMGSSPYSRIKANVFSGPRFSNLLCICSFLRYRNHLFAGLRTSLTGLRADTAMLHPHGRMFTTFLRAGITDIRTKLTIRFGELGVHQHHRDSGLARGRTFLV